jgi:predicted unusual protein kinase regulating ubiquinone biosynthesis (AarF/ABC1/UbiB family)
MHVWRASRTWRLAAVSLRILFRYEWRRRWDRWCGREPRRRDLSSVHQRCADDIYGCAVKMQGLTVKLCQVIGTRGDLFPSEYARTLAQAHDRVPPRRLSEIRPLIEEELGKPLDAVFSELEPIAVAAASLAQVHRARLLDGEEVAVKVQYPDVAEAMRADLAGARALLRLLEKIDPRSYQFGSLLGEMESTIEQELDFVREVESAERVREIFAEEPLIRIPRMYRDLCSRRLIVMEFVGGLKLTDHAGLREAGIDAEEMLVDLSRAYNRMILGSGFFHADPHPGNLLVNCLPSGRLEITFLDFGLAKELPTGFGLALFELMFSMMTNNEAAMIRAFERLGFSTRNGDSSVYLEIARRLMRAAGTEDYQGQFNEDVAEELMNALRENPVVKVPSDFILVARAYALLSGIASSQGLEGDVLDAMAPSAR